MSAAEKVHYLEGEEVVQMLVSIWLDGFLSGGATTLEACGAMEQNALVAAREVIGTLQADPMAMLAVEAEVKERLSGRDTGGKSITVKGTR